MDLVRDLVGREDAFRPNIPEQTGTPYTPRSMRGTATRAAVLFCAPNYVNVPVLVLQLRWRWARVSSSALRMSSLGFR